jgi:histidinol-phosphate/aromatic aminotransferase/cobyric acid decarboxylase-like protein
VLEHGGQLRRAAQQYALPPADWIDLSTGINPAAYQLPPIHEEHLQAWQCAGHQLRRLPESPLLPLFAPEKP